MLPDSEKVVEAIKLLTTPAKGGNLSEGSDSSRFDGLLSENIRRLEETLTSDAEFSCLRDVWWNKEDVSSHLREVTLIDDSSPRWCFVINCLKLLDLLHRSIQFALEKLKKSPSDVDTEATDKKSSRVPPAPPLSPDTLSFGQQKTVLTAVQFVVCLGICPNLQKGVGIPAERRSEFSNLVQASEHFENSNNSLRQYHLYMCVKTLVDCVFSRALGTLILSRHFVDILAALFQLLHIQERESKAVQEKCNITEKTQQSERTSGDQQMPNCGQPLLNSEDNLADLNPASIVDLVRKQVQENDNRMLKQIQQEKSNGVGSQSTERRKEENCSENEKDHSDVSDKSKSAILDETDRSVSVREDKPDFFFCEKVLQDLLDKVYPPLLVKTLLLLQGGPPPKMKMSSSVGKPVVTLSPAPVWLRRRCGRHLTEILMKPKGVISVLRGMLEGPGGGSGSTAGQTSDWRKCDAVAKVIASCPMQTLSVEQYYRVISPQVLEVLHIADQQVARMYQRVACSTISNMAAKYPALTDKYVISPLLQPLLLLTSNTDFEVTDKPHVLVTEQQLTHCIEDIHKVFVSGVCDNVVLMSSLCPVIHPVFCLLTVCRQGVSSLRAACHEILVTFLKTVDSQLTLNGLQVLAFEEIDRADNSAFQKMNQDAVFSHGSDGGIVVVTRSLESETEVPTEELCVDVMVDLLKDLLKDGSAAEFFLYMMKELTSLVSTEIDGNTDKSDNQSGTSGTQLLMDIETQHQSRADQFFRKLRLLNLLAAVCEKIGPDCLKNNMHTLNFVKVTLERAVHVCRATEDVETEVFESETLTMAMGLLTASMTGGLKMKKEERDALQQFLPLLDEISKSHQDNTVQEMASDIRIAIVTHGVVWSEMMKSAAGDVRDMAKTVKDHSGNLKKRTETMSQLPKPKIEVITEISKADKELEYQSISSVNHGEEQRTKHVKAASGSSSSCSKVDENQVDRTTSQPLKQEQEPLSDSNRSELDQVFKELLDPLIPVRGHGLIRLTKIIQAKDPSIIDKFETCYKIFEENLKHEDTYLYLSAVNGLAALCEIQPQTVLPKICAEFAGFQTEEKAKNQSADVIMKVGEVLVKATRNLGELVPRYRELLLNTVLLGTRDCEAQVRASCLSNLGEICRLLHFSLGNVVQEVFLCCSSLLKSDPDLEVKKAAAMALTLLLQGLGQDSVRVLASILKDLYRLLKLVMTTEKDDTVKVHANLALNELDDIMRVQMFPKVKLEKRIRVLDPE